MAAEGVGLQEKVGAAEGQDREEQEELRVGAGEGRPAQAGCDVRYVHCRQLVGKGEGEDGGGSGAQDAPPEPGRDGRERQLPISGQELRQQKLRRAEEAVALAAAKRAAKERCR